MNHLLKQIINFTGFSGIGWILDFTVYMTLALLSVDLFFCNVCGAIAGVTFVFIFSTRFIFKNKNGIPLPAKYAIYVLYQMILVYVISKLLVYIDTFLVGHFSFVFINEFSAVLSKMLVTPVTMFLNFVVMKNIIEKV